MSTRVRRALTRVSMALSFAALLALVVFPAFRRHVWHGGLGIAVCAVVSIVGGLLYLRSTRGGAR